MYIFIETQDGSQSLRLEPEVPRERESESMHSLRGAFSETVYIYGTAIETCLKNGFSPRIFSLGLGMGYVEILAAALMLKNSSVCREDCGGESFELVPDLREWFTAWVRRDLERVPPDFTRAYDSILARTSAETGIDGDSIRSLLAEMIDSGRWKIREALTSSTLIGTRFGCICFDAFSSKTSPELWTDEFLTKFLDQVAAPGCVLSTYACTGALKRALKGAGFQLDIREGFASKRDSTFAVRTGS